MALTMGQRLQVRKAILGAIYHRGSAEWSEIMVAVRFTGLRVKNWLNVRSVLQELLNERAIKRHPCVDKELYLKGPL